MAARDLQVRHSQYGTRHWPTEANLFLGFAEGDGANLAGTGANFAVPCLDGTPIRGTDVMLGITKTASSATAAANGSIEIEIVGPGSIISGRMTTPTNADTAAELLGIMGDYIDFDRSAATAAGVLTIDENEGSGNTHGLFVIDGDIVKGTLEVMLCNTIFRNV